MEQKLPEQFKKDWCAALRSSSYKQGQGRLYDPNDNTYCCLGVASDIFVRHYSEGNKSISYNNLPEGLVENNHPSAERVVQRLITLNDVTGSTFPEIADWIEKEL